MNKQQLASKIWESANKMRSKIEANEYKDYILGFIFYKFLSNKEKDIINLSFGTYGTTLTLQEIANLYGVSKERIRQIKDKAVDRLRNKCKDLHIDIFSK